MVIASIGMDDVVSHIMRALAQGIGGWLVTANLDLLRRHTYDAKARALYDRADLRIADGMPLVWASYLKGTPLPERVAGSSLIIPLCEAAAQSGYRVYLLGGNPSTAEASARHLAQLCPGLVVAGHSAPMVSATPEPSELQSIRRDLLAARPDIVLVAMGSPKQEKVIDALRMDLPKAWWLGVGISFSFLAGEVRRAPALVQQLGLEWAHRLMQEPRRLAKRYLVEDLPFALSLFSHTIWERAQTGKRRFTQH